MGNIVFDVLKVGCLCIAAKISLVLWDNIITDYLGGNGIDSKYSDV